ncbi:MAG: redoxin domain-containing protein [Bradyrhizobiaceae bacterium]|nr:redoxin domain-containing protein [Bradyrhizobiaceae bacterium]
MSTLVTALYLLCAVPSAPPLIKLDQLEQRIAGGADTTYVVNFWATWCKPCVKELGAFDKLGRREFDRPVKVLLVSLDEPRQIDKVEQFYTKRGYTAELVLLDEDKPHLWIDRVSKEWGGSIPATLVVNNNGKLREFFEQEFSYEQLETTITTFLARLP